MFTQHRYLIVILVMSMSISFLCLFTTGCAGKKMIEIDPPSLQLEDGPAFEWKDGTVTDKNDPTDSWEVKKTTPGKCKVKDPATGNEYDSTISGSGKVEFSKELIKKMEDDRQKYWADHPDEFQKWLDEHPEQKKKHEAWLKAQQKARSTGSTSGRDSGGGGGH